ncbi:MAG: hypothetical protein ABIN69_06835 [Aestuariivirga sp.]
MADIITNAVLVGNTVKRVIADNRLNNGNSAKLILPIPKFVYT